MVCFATTRAAAVPRGAVCSARSVLVVCFLKHFDRPVRAVMLVLTKDHTLFFKIRKGVREVILFRCRSSYSQARLLYYMIVPRHQHFILVANL